MSMITARRLDDIDEVSVIWMQEALQEIRDEARQYNPLNGYCERIYFERTKRLRRRGPHKGEARRRLTMEVELMKNLATGKCVQVKDLETVGMDALAEECLANVYIPPDTNPTQHFLDLFRQL